MNDTASNVTPSRTEQKILREFHDDSTYSAVLQSLLASSRARFLGPVGDVYGQITSRMFPVHLQMHSVDSPSSLFENLDAGPVVLVVPLQFVLLCSELWD